MLGLRAVAVLTLCLIVCVGGLKNMVFSSFSSMFFICGKSSLSFRLAAVHFVGQHQKSALSSLLGALHTCVSLCPLFFAYKKDAHCPHMHTPGVLNPLLSPRSCAVVHTLCQASMVSDLLPH